MRPVRRGIWTAALAAGCHAPAAPLASAPTGGQQFAELSASFLEGWLQLNPVSATRLGEHSHDHRWPDVSAQGMEREAAWLRDTQQRLALIPVEDLDPEQQIDAAILAHRLEADLFAMQELRPWENNPLSAVYTVGAGLDYLVSRDFAPLEQRRRSLQGRLEALPLFLDQAQAALGEPPQLHTQTAIDQSKALVSWTDGPLRAELSEGNAELLAAAEGAEQALRDFQRFLEEDLLPRADGDFRLGAERYARKQRYATDTDLSSEQVVAQAWELLERTTEEMAAQAALLHPSLFPDEALPQDEDPSVLIRRVLDRIADDHPDDDSVIQAATRTLEEATAFVAQHDLVSLPDEPVRVIEMPEFKRGVAIAYCDAPGPLEESRETFYAIAPPPASWPEQRRTSFYREYNHAMLQELTIHEAMPGHFLQFAHAARFQAPVRTVFTSGTFIEGWALYAERFMADAGYGGPQVKLQQLKMLLRLCLNAIIDHGVHAGDMQRDEALALMTDRGFQEEGEAEGKWKRACLTSAQLSTYLVGLLEVSAIRRDYEAKAGQEFDLKAFNDELLAHGAPPPRHLRRLLGLEE